MLLGISLGASLIAAELAIRIVAPQQLIQVRPDIWQPSQSIGWIRRPDLNTTINTGERSVRLMTDAEGFRVGDGGRSAGDTRILLLGDSFMAALQVEYEESFAGLLETQHQASVLNAGVDGWDPNHYLIRARTALGRHDVDALVVALYLGNDVVPSRIDSFPPRAPAAIHTLRFPRSLSSREITDAMLRPLNDYYERRSHFYVFAKNRLQVLRMKLGLTAAYFPTNFLKSQATSRQWRVTADICKDLAELAATYDVPTLFVLVPTPHQVDRSVFTDYLRGFGIDSNTVDLDQPNHLLGAALAEHGLNVLDPTETFRQAHRDQPDLYGRVDRHFTPRGHQVLAAAVGPTLVELLAER